jgi:hypothetical protein
MTASLSHRGEVEQEERHERATIVTRERAELTQEHLGTPTDFPEPQSPISMKGGSTSPFISFASKG